MKMRKVNAQSRPAACAASSDVSTKLFKADSKAQVLALFYSVSTFDWQSCCCLAHRPDQSFDCQGSDLLFAWQGSWGLCYVNAYQFLPEEVFQRCCRHLHRWQNLFGDYVPRHFGSFTAQALTL